MKKVLTVLKIGTLGFVFFGNALAMNDFEDVTPISAEHAASVNCSIDLIDGLFPIIRDDSTKNFIDASDTQTCLIPINIDLVRNLRENGSTALSTLKNIASTNTARLSFKKYLEQRSDENDESSESQFNRLCSSHGWVVIRNENFSQIFALNDSSGNFSNIDIQSIQNWERPEPSSTEEHRLVSEMLFRSENIARESKKLRKDIPLCSERQVNDSRKRLNDIIVLIHNYEKKANIDNLVKMLKRIYSFVREGSQAKGGKQLNYQFDLHCLRLYFLSQRVGNYSPCPLVSVDISSFGDKTDFGNKDLGAKVACFFDSLEKKEDGQLQNFLNTGTLTVDQLVSLLLSDPFLFDFDRLKSQIYLYGQATTSAILSKNFKEDMRRGLEKVCRNAQSNIDESCLTYADRITNSFKDENDLIKWLNDNYTGFFAMLTFNSLRTKVKAITKHLNNLSRNQLDEKASSGLLKAIQEMRKEAEDRKISNDVFIDIIFKGGDPMSHRSFLDYINYRTALYVITEFILNRSQQKGAMSNSIVELCREIHDRVNPNSSPSGEDTNNDGQLSSDLSLFGENIDNNNQSNPYSNLSDEGVNNND